jgi:transcriptional regulator with XRE-family HTH domain
MTEGAKRGSDDARAWASELAEAFGKAVQLHRKRLGLSAVQLSNRCAEIGYPITRATLAKIETNGRNSKMDLAEILTLAAALEVGPGDLAFPGYPYGLTRATPRATMPSVTARCWFDADYSYNEFEELHTPRITLSKELRQAVEDFESAVQSFARRHQIEDAVAGDYYLADQRPPEKGREVDSFAKYQLGKEYAQIKELHGRVQELGGYVPLPGWFGTYYATPF